MGCAPSSRRNGLIHIWGDSFNNSVVPASHFPDEWTTSPVVEPPFNDSRLSDAQTLDQPPPYTVVAPNGHISLMHGYGTQMFKTEEVSDQSVDLTANELSILEASHDNDCSTSTPSPYQGDQLQETVQYSPLRVDQLSHSLDVVGSHSLFQPVRASSPLHIDRLPSPPERNFPVRPRSRSVEFVSLHSSETGDSRVSFPNRPSLPPLPHAVSTSGHPVNAVNDQTFQEMPDNHFPARPRDRLPPLHHQFSQPVMHSNVHAARRTSGDGQIRTRRKKKRKRTHTWHGERVAPQAIPVIEQDATNSSPLEE